MLQPIKSNVVKLESISQEAQESDLFIIYKVEKNGLMHTGLIALVYIASDSPLRIHKHELVSDNKLKILISDLVDSCHQDQPIMLLYKNDNLENLLESHIQNNPSIIKQDSCGKHTLWLINNKDQIDSIRKSCDFQNLYIADGHHRYQAFKKIAKSGYILSMLIPFDKVNLYSFTRIINQIKPIIFHNLLTTLSSRFFLKELDTPIKLTSSNELLMYYKKTWYLIIFSDNQVECGIRNFQEKILNPIFKIENDDLDNIEFIPNMGDYSHIAEKVDQSSCSIAFLFNDLSIPNFINTIEKKKVLPVHSTCFLPKPSKNIFTYKID